MDVDEVFVDELGNRRMRYQELVVPICVGSVAFWLGKKASEFNSHRWVVYVRGPNNEDISHIFPKVTFGLHHTFKDPDRLHESQPYEVTEHGWGEFDIGIKLHLAVDALGQRVPEDKGVVEVFHRLKLYSEEDGAQQNTKKPVVSETYDELVRSLSSPPLVSDHVFSQPTEALYQRVRAAQANPKPAPISTVAPYFPKIDEADELAKLRENRVKVAGMVQDLKKQFEAVAATG